MRECCAYFDELPGKVLAKGGDGYSISFGHLNHGWVRDLLTNRDIVAHAKDRPWYSGGRGAVAL